jgi:hypothetical protein
MNDGEVVFLRIKEAFRRDPKTSWGKNQIVDALDELHDLYKKENKKGCNDI